MEETAKKLIVNQERSTFSRTLKSQIRRLSTSNGNNSNTLEVKTRKRSNDLDSGSESVIIREDRDLEDLEVGEITQNLTRESSPMTLTDDSGCSFKLICDSNDTSVSVSPTPMLSPPTNVRRKTPLPADSPLLRSHTSSPQLQKLKNFNKNLRRARSFRAQHRHRDASESSCNSENNNNHNDHVTFSIKKTKFGRRGWMVMLDGNDEDHETNGMKWMAEVGIMDRVLTNIRDLELAGHAVPEKMTIRIK